MKKEFTTIVFSFVLLLVSVPVVHAQFFVYHDNLYGNIYTERGDFAPQLSAWMRKCIKEERYTKGGISRTSESVAHGRCLDRLDRKWNGKHHIQAIK